MTVILLSPESKKFMEAQAGEIFRIHKTALKKYEKLKEDYPGWDFKNDPRLYFFGQIINHCSSTVLLLVAVADCLADSNWLARRVTPRSVEDFQRVFDQMETSIRRNFLVSGWSIFENAIRRIVTTIQNKPATGSAHNICDDLYRRHLNHPKANETMELIKLVTTARNTIHNDGFYYPAKGEDIILTYKSDSYQFYVGQQITFFTWDFAQKRMNDLVDTFEDTVRCSPVAGLSM